MSSEDKIDQLAKHIAERVAREEVVDSEEQKPTANDEVSRLREQLAQVNRRLVQLESASASNNPVAGSVNRTQTDARNETFASSTTPRPPYLFGTSGTYVSTVHPSQQRFGIDEAVAELVNYFEEQKTCEMEPGGKPCDHCGMCSARGF